MFFWSWQFQSPVQTARSSNVNYITQKPSLQQHNHGDLLSNQSLSMMFSYLRVVLGYYWGEKTQGCVSWHFFDQTGIINRRNDVRAQQAGNFNYF